MSCSVKANSESLVAYLAVILDNSVLRDCASWSCNFFYMLEVAYCY